MFPWSDHCLYERVRRRRRLGEEQDVLDKWTQDVCSGEELPEVEIISLVEEQIPKYKLRADTLTSFTGYENQDWYIQDPALRVEDIPSPLTPEQIRETLNYFLLCSTRVSQMTKTYNDIEAVTRLLEEKEKDIELTARIGKELLAHNSKLESNVASLENELRLCNEKITQLSHELLKKNELIQVLTNDVDDSGSEAGTPTSGKPGVAHFEILQKRISNLEFENASLRSEASRLATQTEDSEEQEAKLVADLVAQLELCRTDLGNRGLEAERNRYKELELKEQVEHLQAKLQASNEKFSEAVKENEECISMLALSRETQSELATELADLKEKYAEVLSVLEELRENMRKSNKKSQPTARAGPLYPSLHTSVQIKNPDSLAAELECSLFSELSLDSGIGGASTTSVPNYKKVFETVRCASRASSLNSGEPSSTSSPAPRLGGTCITPSSAFTPMSSRPRTSSYIPIPYESSSLSDSEEITVVGKVCSGIVPGSSQENLETALKRLTPAAIDARRAALASGIAASSPFNIDVECPTPDSILSSGSNYTPWKLPDKLQIVKPLEGSLTLHHWSELATPSLGGLLDERPGVKIRGGTDLEDLGLQMYSLCDVEEDDEINPGKSFQNTSHIYTYTNSTVMHPDDYTNVTSSIRGSQMCISATSSQVSSVCPTPVTRSRRNSTSTFSTTPGLAALLNERGIRAVTPSALVTPEYTPTATPCNSPARSPSPTDDDSYSSLGLPGFLMTSGAEMLRRALGSAIKSPTAVRSTVMGGGTPSGKSPMALARPDKKAALTGIRLVEKLERIGIEEILATTTASSSSGGGTTLHQAAIRRTPLKEMQRGSGILGVPGRPGRGELEARLSQLPAGRRVGRVSQGGRQVRPDLGYVPGHPANNVRRQQVNQKEPDHLQPPSQHAQPTTLGTLSSLLFGRKGGLL